MSKYDFQSNSFVQNPCTEKCAVHEVYRLRGAVFNCLSLLVIVFIFISGKNLLYGEKRLRLQTGRKNNIGSSAPLCKVARTSVYVIGCVRVSVLHTFT